MPIPNSFAAGSARAFGFLGNVSPSDPYFNYVTMLLPGNGTNGAQNNTFRDSSTNNLTITRNGNTTQGTFSPYGNNWSNFFDGSGDYLSAAANSAFNLSGDFTIECWLYPTSHPTAVYLIGQTSNTDYAPVIVNLSNGRPGIAASATGSAWFVNANTASAIPTNTWTHIAAVRSGNKWSMYVNGVENVLAASAAGTPYNSTDPLGIGSEAVSPLNYPYVGYISNVRIVNGTAVYTSNFTPPTAPLTAISGTSLLTCQSNRFRDASTNNFTITRNGDTSVQRFSPFSPTASYAPSIDGGSGYFDGNGDYLAGIGTTSSFNFMHQSSALFTVEAWIYPTVAQESTIIDNPNGTSNQTGVIFYMKADRTLRFFISRSASSSWVVDGTTTGTVNLNSWNHVVATYDQSQASNNLNLYINGVNAGTASKTGNTPASGNASNPMAAGALVSGALYLVGNLSDVRITNSIVYTSAFTPPTAPLTAISGTSLLLSMTNAGIIDNAEMNNLETVGNAQISTAQSKFGSGSIFLDGTGDGVYAPSSQNFALPGDFTIEFWLYQTATSGEGTAVYNPTTNGFNIFMSISGNWGIARSNVAIDNNFGTTPSFNTWNHIAISRNTGTIRAFVNGNQVFSGANPTSYVAGPLQIGISGFGSITGYIDDLRITKGYARYTANFTPPSQPLPTK
jgi:hypothetical protein